VPCSFFPAQPPSDSGWAQSQHVESCCPIVVCSSSSLFVPVCSIPEDNARKATSLANQTWIFESTSASKLGISLRLASDLQSRVRHAAIVDMPEVTTLTHALPDTWHTLPPVHPNDEPTSTSASDFGARSVFGQVGPIKPRFDSTDLPRSSLSLVELTLTIPRDGD
jgi:hypothetical protein